MTQFKEIPANKLSLSHRSYIFGVGINNANYLTNGRINGKKVSCPYYVVWHSMLRRCYSKILLEKRPTYIKCEVTPDWLLFSNFKNWMVKQDWEGKQLDKDIIKPNNTLYSPEYCVFVSSEVNNLILDSGKIRGKHPQGVVWHKRNKKFTTNLKINGKKVHIGSFVNVDDASNSYIIAKCKHVTEIAQTHSDERVTKGLMEHVALLRGGLI